jgi:hypothetical protein
MAQRCVFSLLRAFERRSPSRFGSHGLRAHGSNDNNKLKRNPQNQRPIYGVLLLQRGSLSCLAPSAWDCRRHFRALSRQRQDSHPTNQNNPFLRQNQQKKAHEAGRQSPRELVASSTFDPRICQILFLEEGRFSTHKMVGGVQFEF